jgi:hypothetical protein
MATPNQIAASQANVRNSTKYQAPESKIASSRNRLSHSFLSSVKAQKERTKSEIGFETDLQNSLEAILTSQSFCALVENDALGSVFVPVRMPELRAKTE